MLPESDYPFVSQKQWLQVIVKDLLSLHGIPSPKTFALPPATTEITAGALAETKHQLAAVVIARVRASAHHSKNVSYFSKYKV